MLTAGVGSPHLHAQITFLFAHHQHRLDNKCLAGDAQKDSRAVDFSATSRKAMHYVMAFAKLFNSQMVSTLIVDRKVQTQ